MGKFLAAFIADDSPLLSREMRAEMLRPQPGAAIQGLGWRITGKSRPGFIWHGGDSPGFAAFAGFDPRTKTGLAVMTNLGDNLVFAPAHGVTLGTASEVFGLPPVPPSSAPAYVAMVTALAIATVAALLHAVRLIRRRADGRPRARSRLRTGLSAAFGIVLVLLAAAVVLLPRTLFGAPIDAAWVFMPDMTILLIACGAALLLAGMLHLLRLFRRQTTPRS